MLQDIYILEENEELRKKLKNLFTNDDVEYEFKDFKINQLDDILLDIPTMIIIDEDYVKENILEVCTKIRENEDNSITLEGRYRGGPERGPHQVAKKKSNAYGLYDMIGNVSEWCVSEWCYESNEFGKYDIRAFALGGNYNSDRNFIPNGEFIVNKKLTGDDKYPEEYRSFLVPRAGFRIVRSIK